MLSPFAFSLAFASVAAVQTAAAPTEIRFLVRDSLAVVADVHRGPAGVSGPTILLFHQGGGSARGEYRAITPRLVREGYNVIAADIRGGGDRFGAPNRLGSQPAGTFRYCEALAEVDAAVNLARVRGFTGPLVLWGSSYSATLALQVAARRSADVRAVLAFSPASGEPMQGCEPAPYVGWLARAGVPTLVLRPRVELGDSSRAAALEAMRRDGAEVFVAEQGVHGSSILDAERTKASTEPQWNAVRAFLRRALEPRKAPPGERAVSIESDGWVLRGDLRLPERRPAPLVVLLHKAAGDRTAYRDLAGRLAAAGIGSLRVDLRGHGETVNRGRFVPGQPGIALDATERDVAAIWRFVRAAPGVDTSRLGLVGGSYSSQAAAVAGREAGYARAQVALSPGDFSDESFRAAAGSEASWLFVRSDAERFVGDWLDAKVRELAPGAELWVVAAGSAHATDLLAADSTLSARLTEWLRQRLAPLAPVRVVYLANEGVMLESAAGRVYIDALFGDGLPEYSVVPAPNRDSLERALGGYGGPAVVLTTHAHRDHFDSAAVGRYLGSNPDAVALGPPGTPQRRDSTSLDLDWVKVRPVAVPHGPTRRPIGHTGYLVTLGGTTALHVGDTTSEPGTWPALGLPHEGVDIALVPYWYAFDDERFRELLNVVGRARVVLLHAPLPAAESEDLKGRGGWSAVSRSLRERHARVRTPLAPGEVVEP